jgi:hypothetical protein
VETAENELITRVGAGTPAGGSTDSKIWIPNKSI